MSWETQAWVWCQPDLAANEKLVALALGNHGDEYGNDLRPGVPRLAHMTGLSESTVKRCIKSLLESGILILVQEAEGRGTTNEYRMPVDLEMVAAHHKKGFNFVTKKGVQLSKGVQTRAERGSNEGEKGCQADLQDSNIKHSVETKARARENAPHYLPENWRPSVEDAAYANSLGVDPERLALDFKAYWFNANGERARKKNWSLTWQTWCRKEADRGASGLTLANGHNGHAAVRIAANAPPDAWKPLADKFSADGAGIMRPEVEGCFIDLYAQSICEIAGFDPNEPRSDWHVMVEWAREGLFSEKSAVWNEYLEPELKKLCSRPGYKTPGGLAYFSKPLRENWR
jgi:hypothetical protein